MDPDPDPDPFPDLTPFFIDFKYAKKYFCCPQTHHLTVTKFYLQAIFQTLNTFMRKGKEPDPDPYL
jgi:hypothetical protein